MSTLPFPSLRCVSWLLTAVLCTSSATALACSPKDTNKAAEQSAVTQTAQVEAADTKAPEKPEEAAKATPAPEPSPVNIVVRNATKAEVQLDITYGPATFLSVIDKAGEQDRIWLDVSSHCECDCANGTQCPECARPLDEFLPLAPGVEHTLAWNGRLRRGTAGGCHDVIAPPAGVYLFRACGRPEDGCSVVEVELPASQPIVLELDGSTPRATACDAVGADVQARAVKWLERTQRRPYSGSNDDRAASCDLSAARCFDSVASVPTVEPGGACLIAVIPSDEQLEARMVFPPRGEDTKFYSVFLDAKAIALLRVDWQR